MLPSASRLRAAPDWTATRRGATAGRATVVVRISRIEGERRLAGLAVSKAVGGAVVRNTVKRRLRAILVGVLPELPPGTGIVVRALPPAAQASFGILEGDVRGATAAALRKGSA